MSEKLEQEKISNVTSYDDTDFHHDDASRPEPTEEDWATLREASDSLPTSAFFVIAIEFCERFTYYGLSGPFQNYIQHPAPPSCTYINTSISIPFSLLIHRLLYRSC